MKALFFLLIFSASSFGAPESPLSAFKEELATPVQTPLPLFWVTWDEDSPENQKLADTDIYRYIDIRKKKAKTHERFVAFIFPGGGITYDDRGNRADRLDVDSVQITPFQFLIWMSDDKHPWGVSVARWASVKSCQVAIKAEDAFVELLSFGTPDKLVDAPAVKVNFFSDARSAADAYDDIKRGRASIDQRRKLLAFIQKYGSK